MVATYCKLDITCGAALWARIEFRCAFISNRFGRCFFARCQTVRLGSARLGLARKQTIENHIEVINIYIYIFEPCDVYTLCFCVLAFFVIFAYSRLNMCTAYVEDVLMDKMPFIRKSFWWYLGEINEFHVYKISITPLCACVCVVISNIPNKCHCLMKCRWFIFNDATWTRDFKTN